MWERKFQLPSEGPNTDPCGMPNSSLMSGDQRNKHAGWYMSARNDHIQASMIPSGPKLDCRQDSEMSWLTQSNATLKSSKANRCDIQIIGSIVY